MKPIKIISMHFLFLVKEEGKGRTNLVVQSQIFSSWDSIETREMHLKRSKNIV